MRPLDLLDLGSLLLGLALGFVAFRLLEMLQVSGARLRYRRAVRELEIMKGHRDAGRILRVVRKYESRGGDKVEHTLYEGELRDLFDVIVGSAEPFAHAPCFLPPQVTLAPGEVLVVLIAGEKPIAIEAEVARAVALPSRP